MRVLSFPEAEVPDELREQAHALQDLAWPDGRGRATGPRHDPALSPVSMLLVGDGRVVAALAILSKRVEHGGQDYAASGLSTVVTDPGLRLQGHGRRLVNAAREAIAAGGADLGIFTCDPWLQAFYEGAGWERFAGTIMIGGTREAPLPSDHLGKVTMGCLFSARARLQAATFPGGRIELYPGSIDRLW